MGNVVISVEGLSKSYRLRHQKSGGSDGLRHVLNRWATAPIRALTRRGVRPDESSSTEETFWALRDISFEIKRGEVVGFVGRNGAGKSTLLKVLSRITEPTCGRVRIKGRVASLLEVGTGFHPELTGRENIYLNGAILGMSRMEIKKKFDEIVAFAEVEKFLDTPVKYYSSGMYVRLAFAVSAHLEPDILIVDEVLAVGDLPFQKKCLGKMREVSQGEGRTVLFVSHNIPTVKQLCGRAILLKDGSVLRQGPTSQVLDHYVALYSSSKSYRQNFTPGGKPKIVFAELEIDQDQGNVCLSIRLIIRTPRSLRCSIEMILNDNMGSPVGFADAGLLDPTQIVELSEGENHFQCKIILPSMAQGTYNVSVQIADPLIEIFHKIESNLGFELVRVNSGLNRRPLDQSRGYGSLELPLIVSPVQVYDRTTVSQT
jgi:lipopolysaccharide transport system ATP-binding protein